MSLRSEVEKDTVFIERIRARRRFGWASDLILLLRRLPTAVELQADDLLCEATVKATIADITRIVDEDLQHDIDTLVKTHLLRNRLHHLCHLRNIPRRPKHRFPGNRQAAMFWGHPALEVSGHISDLLTTVPASH
ncbi:hypothetical protein R3P38DRAFT_3186647 [Favolaschia claudopus]|uniref:Uncharacterized protein n=1 Tax=Favolaschia claudopus TaxID=2862362 RepID=A0AAW0C0P3_9AGAR